MSLFCNLKGLGAKSTRDDAKDLLDREHLESNILDNSDLSPVNMDVNFCSVDEQ